jgi:hypothetical protein
MKTIEEKAANAVKDRYPGLSKRKAKRIVHEVMLEEEERELEELRKTVEMGDPE